MSRKKPWQTVGHKYYAGLHLIFCHKFDRLLKIKVADKTAWEGDVAENTTVAINQPDLFGGDDREGGIVGKVDVEFGGPSQPQNGYLQSLLGAAIPAYRGLMGVVVRGDMDPVWGWAGEVVDEFGEVVTEGYYVSTTPEGFKGAHLTSNNPYIKPWSFLGQRTLTGWHDEWSTITASDGYKDMNPVHIIRETLTDTTWGGLGYPEADLDNASFESAAYILAQGIDPNQEAFGLSLVWSNNTSVEDFLGLILNHIEAALFVSHITGLLTLRLIRNDYTLSMLPVLDESTILEMVEFKGSSAAEATNQVSIDWVDRDNNARTTTVHDIAGITRANGQVIGASFSFVGVATEDLAQKIAARELQQLTVPLSTLIVEINRKNFSLQPGDCFKFSWSAVGVSEMLMRVATVEINTNTDGRLRITAMRDIYGLGMVPFTTPATSLWSDPISAPANAIYRRVEEATWLDFVTVYGESAAILAELDDTSTLVVGFCGSPSRDAVDPELWSRNAGVGDYLLQDTGIFTPVGASSHALVPELTTVIQLEAGYILTSPVIGDVADLGGELVCIRAFDPVGNAVTVDRGILDTVPIHHAAGTKIWYRDTSTLLDQTDRVVTEQVEVKFLPATSRGRLALADATTESITCVGRMMRPLPAGNVQINGLRWPSSIGALDELTVSWAHRDRLMQTAVIIRQDAGDIGPEVGTTYTLRIYGETGLLLRTVPGLTTTAYTYLQADEETDSGFIPARLNTSLRIELESVRGSLTSFKTWNLSVVRV